jgi:hypothetical protein
MMSGRMGRRYTPRGAFVQTYRKTAITQGVGIAANDGAMISFVPRDRSGMSGHGSIMPFAMRRA